MGPMTNDNDALLAEKLRREDPEQYHTLIRMHLSFLLDLNTDETDSTSDKVKSRVLKWNLLPFSKKSKPSTKGVMEGAPLTQEGICQVYQLIEYLSKEQSIQQEGIFRRSGKLRRQQELKALLNQGITLDLSAGHYSVHDCASVLKNFLAELPEPLLTDAHYPAHFQIAEMCAAGAEGKSDSRLLTALQLLLLLLPAENRVLLSDLLNLLHLTASYQHVNRMSAESLATLFTPHLACPRKMPPEALHTNSQLMSRVIAFMIRQGQNSLFSIPPQLATDIRAYWARKELNESEPSRKVFVGCKDLKGEKKADSESAEVNTVFSFVDRERTAQAHNTNTTEAALAQLYAHIRSLPESSEKRRLVKQFNKENGLGTPHQHYPRILNPRGRSLGDSIKKHLFNKGIKCPKNGVHQGHFNVLVQASTDKSNSPDGAPTPKLMMFQKNVDELSPLPKMSSYFSPSSSSTSGNQEEPSSILSQRKLVFSDSSSSEKSQDLVNLDPSNVPIELNYIESNKYRGDPSTILKFNQKDNLIEDKLSTADSSQSSNTLRRNCPIKLDSTLTCAKNNTTKNSDLNVPVEDDFHSPSKHSGCSEGRSWLQNSISSPITHLVVPSKHLKPMCSEVRSLVTSTPASHHPRHTSRMRARSSIETSLLCHQTSCLLTPVNSEENNSMSPITRSTQKMSKAMQETMMTPRSRKPVLVLSGSNISNFSSMVQCSHLHSEEKGDQSSLKCKPEESIAKLDTPRKKESIGPYSKLNFAESSVSTSTPSISKNEPVITTDEFKITDSDSLSSTFVNYLQSRSVLTATPVDLSFKEENSFDEIDFKSLKSEEELSESLLYCLDGNEPPGDSSFTPEPDEVNISPPKDNCQSRPLKRTSIEAKNEDLVTSHTSIRKLVPNKHQNSHTIRVNSTPDVPKNSKVFETSL